MALVLVHKNLLPLVGHERGDLLGPIGQYCQSFLCSCRICFFLSLSLHYTLTSCVPEIKPQALSHQQLQTYYFLKICICFHLFERQFVSWSKTQKEREMIHLLVLSLKTATAGGYTRSTSGARNSIHGAPGWQGPTSWDHLLLPSQALYSWELDRKQRQDLNQGSSLTCCTTPMPTSPYL